MPMSDRTAIISCSASWSMRWPFTHTAPASALSSPRRIFSEIDLPAPLAPRMILVCPDLSVKLTSLRITFSSKASDTWSNTTTGASVSFTAWPAEGRGGDGSMVELVEQLDQHLADEEVDGDHRHRPGDDGHGRGAPDPLGPAARPEADMARDRHDHETKGEWLDDSHPDILHVQTLQDR